MPEIQDIFHEFGPAFRATHKLPLRHLKAMRAIESCRTAKLGGHLDRCAECGHLRISYNSCRNRHCPKCQGSAREKWLKDRMGDLLPARYFHVVFTLPDLLNPLALRNQRAIYGLLFRAASETLLELAGDPKYLGARIGLIAVLHTWGQNLMDHPHLHCVVPGGGFTPEGYWRRSRKKFFLPVRVLSRKFRGKFLALLKEAYHEGKLSFPGAIADLEASFPQLLNRLYGMEWVVYCKKPFADPEYVLRYLCLYTHRVAISNSRIVGLEDGKVTFKWRDYKDRRRQTRLMTLAAPEFIRRFLLHILPERFVKIRHYGILSNRTRRVKIALCRRLTGWRFWRIAAPLPERAGTDPWLCPRCGKGRMAVARWFDLRSLSPPFFGKAE